MSTVALIWIAFLQAFSFATASTAVRRENAGGRLDARVETTARWIGTSADVPVSDVRLPVRAPLRAARADVWRAGSSVTHGKGPSALPSAHGTHALAAPFLRQQRHQRASETHRLASRGALLPYFPTAPPRRA